VIKNIVAREEYVDSKGVSITSWNKIGIIISKNGKEYIKLFIVPNVLYSVFEEKPKDKTGEVSDKAIDIEEGF